MKNKYLIIISIIVFVNENVFSQNEVKYLRPSGVLKDFDTKKYGIIDKNGDTIVPFIYDLLPNSFSEKMIAKKNGKFGIINSKNQILVDFKYNELYSYHPYFITYTKNNKSDEFKLCSVLDTNFVTIVSEKENYNKIETVAGLYERTTEYYKRNIVFKAYNFKKRQVLLLFKNGEIFQTFPYDDIKGMDNYLKVIMNRPDELNDLEGLIDWNGNILFKPEYRYISWIDKDNVCLYIDIDNSNAQIVDLKTKKIKVNTYPRIMEPEGNDCFIIGKYSNNIDYQGIINSAFEEIYPMCNCTIYYIKKDNVFSITDNITKKIDYLPCN
ncbi:MAG: WG repeat-containing protein [Saprospiraceae bacterium]|nr:WG repeat-containing protein [Saprospiraceae bacterium]